MDGWMERWREWEEAERFESAVTHSSIRLANWLLTLSLFPILSPSASLHPSLSCPLLLPPSGVAPNCVPEAKMQMSSAWRQGELLLCLII